MWLTLDVTVLESRIFEKSRENSWMPLKLQKGTQITLLHAKAVLNEFAVTSNSHSLHLKNLSRLFLTSEGYFIFSGYSK